MKNKNRRIVYYIESYTLRQKIGWNEIPNNSKYTLSEFINVLFVTGPCNINFRNNVTMILPKKKVTISATEFFAIAACENFTNCRTSEIVDPWNVDALWTWRVAWYTAVWSETKLNVSCFKIDCINNRYSIKFLGQCLLCGIFEYFLISKYPSPTYRSKKNFAIFDCWEFRSFIPSFLWFFLLITIST